MKAKELFTGAQFGDHYLCRDGRHALFLSFVDNPEGDVRIYHEHCGMVIHKSDGGLYWGENINKDDIVTRCGANGWDKED